MLEAGLMSAVRIVKSLLTLDFSQQIERVKIDSAVQSLRQIFFFHSELRDVLEKISEGGSVELEVAEYFAEQFRSIPLEIENALTFLRSERFEDARRVLIDDMQVMRQIYDGKISTRREISRFFRSFIEDGGVEISQKKYRDEASRLLGQIDRLNSAIKECEERLLAARSAKAAKTPRRAANSSSAKKAKKRPRP
jgi:hypothetical protein